MLLVVVVGVVLESEELDVVKARGCDDLDLINRKLVGLLLDGRRTATD